MKTTLIALIGLVFFIISCQKTGTEPKSAYVDMYKGKPTIFINDSAYIPMQYGLTHAYGGRWSWEEVPNRQIKNFGEAGFQMYQVDLYFEDIWHKDQQELDIAKAQKQVRGVLDANPKANVVIRVHVNAPFWWNDANPDECTEYANGPVDQRHYGAPLNNEDGDTDRPKRASLASEKWRKESGERLQEFCKRMSVTEEGKNVIGIHVCGGIYGEWHYWGFISNDPDIGKAMTKHFQNWLKNKYKNDQNLQKAWNTNRFTLTNASVPDTTERKFSSEDIFRDPSKERRVIDYFTCQQEVVADDIEYFCKIVRDNWPRKCLIGVFYGYFHMTFCRQATGGHLFIERILNSPYIDYLSAPQSYWGDSRKLGGSGNSRGVIESALLHKKLWLDEMDNGHLQNLSNQKDIRNALEEDPDYVPVLRRSSVYPLMRGCGLWYYDFGPQRGQGWWDRPKYMQNIKEEKQFFDKNFDKEFKSAADVLYVWDMESFYYVKNTWTPVCYNQLDVALEEMLLSGTSGDHIYLFDLDKVDLSKYKVIVFTNVYKITQKQREFIKQKVADNNRTLFWNYMPGYTDGVSRNLSFIEELTGFKIERHPTTTSPKVKIVNPAYEFEFQSPVNPMVTIEDQDVQKIGTLAGSNKTIVARKKYNNHTSVFSTLPLHGTNVFRQLFKEAGVHIYNEINDFTYANNLFVLIHTKDGGKRNILLKNGKKIVLEIPAKSSYLLDANTGEIVLK